MLNSPLRTALLLINLLAVIVLATLGWNYYSAQRDIERNDKPWLVYPNLPFDTLQSAVVVGQVMSLKVERCNTEKTARIYTFSTRMINDDDPHAPPINLPGNAAIQLEPGCSSETSSANRVPMSTPAGRYHFEGLASIPTKYHTYFVPWKSKTFQVVAAEPAK